MSVLVIASVLWSRVCCHPERSEGSRKPEHLSIPRSFSRCRSIRMTGCWEINMRRILIAVICLFALFTSNPAQAGWRDWISPSRNWQRIKNCCRSTSDAVTGYCHRKVERAKADQAKLWGLKLPPNLDQDRSEERRVGKECDAGSTGVHFKQTVR